MMDAYYKAMLVGVYQDLQIAYFEGANDVRQWTSEGSRLEDFSPHMGFDNSNTKNAAVRLDRVFKDLLSIVEKRENMLLERIHHMQSQIIDYEEQVMRKK